jgi:hypothetical protein
VDLWGNYVLALVVTNTNTGGVSETDPREIPSAALVVVKVLSAGNGLEKPAAGQRGWTAALHRLIDLVDGSGAGVGAHTLTDHSDVVDATGAAVGGVDRAQLRRRSGSSGLAACTDTGARRWIRRPSSTGGRSCWSPPRWIRSTRG